MKTQIITIATVIFTTLGVSNSTFAATAKNNDAAYTVLTDVSKINKIEVHGNVELYVSDAATDQVKVYNKYYSESALVQSKNGVLRITSYNTEKLVVWVSANDLRSISAYDNAEVKSFGDLSKVEFDVDLHDNATAKLNIDAYTAKLVVNDNARAYVSGNAQDFSMVRSATSNVNNRDLKAVTYSQKTVIVPVAVDRDDLATL